MDGIQNKVSLDDAGNTLIRYGGDLMAEFQRDEAQAISLAEAARRYFRNGNHQVVLRWTSLGRPARGLKIILPSVIGSIDGHTCRVTLPSWCLWHRSTYTRLATPELSVRETIPTCPKSHLRRTTRQRASGHQAAVERMRGQGMKVGA